MIPGIKTGPRDWTDILSKYKPLACEIWYRVDKEKEYQKMFKLLKKMKVKTGLHFWGMLANGFMPNFVFDDNKILEESIGLVKKTIETAAKWKFYYVNIHPGSLILTKINLDRLYLRQVAERATSLEKGRKILKETILELTKFAEKLGVLLTVETLPCREPLHWRNLFSGRKQTHDFKNIPASELINLAKEKVNICNDIGHTLMDITSKDREYLFQELYKKTKLLSENTKLIHLNTTLPPFNGTDCHMGIRDEDFENGVFPDREQIKILLRIFKDREDVLVIPEPESHHIENSKALDKLIEEVEK